MATSSFFATTPRVVVGISDLAVTNSQNLTLTTYALGSCVGVIAFAPRVKAAGLLHAMLPKMKRNMSRQETPNMFVDTGMAALLHEILAFGATKAQIKIALIGGASVNSASNFFKIGEDNIAAVKAFCANNGLRIAYENHGGKVNRTVHFQMTDYKINIKKPRELEEINFA
jgi:chemotaxis protein CheD